MSFLGIASLLKYVSPEPFPPEREKVGVEA